MGTAYYDPRSIILRLDRTICMYKGEPVYCEARYAQGGVAADRDDDFHKLHCYMLTRMDRKAKVIDYRDADFDYRAFPLGYMNYQGAAFYLRRIPARIQKQGLCRNAIHSEPVIAGADWYQSEAIRNTILNIYPSVGKALEMVEEGETRSTAIHRSFALSGARPVALLYKGRTIGYREKNGKFRLLDNKEAEAISILITEAFKGEICLAK